MTSPTAPPPARPSAKPATRPAQTQAPARPTSSTPSTTSRFRIEPLADSKVGERIGIYGTGGIGKTELAALAPSPAFIDLDKGAKRAPGARGVPGIVTWQDVRDALHDESIWASEGCRTIVIDSLTAAQELAVAHVIEHVKTDKGHAVQSIEGYGYGKGYRHVYEAFMLLLADLEVHMQRGRHIVLVCHETTAATTNPEGDDFPRYEPDLLQPGKVGRIRDRFKNWVDHLVRIGYDVTINKDGKAIGVGTRCIYPTEMAAFWAKSRLLSDPIVYTKGSPELWNQLLGKE